MLEQNLQKIIENIKELFSSSPIYRAIVENNTPAASVFRLAGDRNFCETAGMGYGGADLTLIAEEVMAYHRKNYTLISAKTPRKINHI